MTDDQQRWAFEALASAGVGVWRWDCADNSIGWTSQPASSIGFNGDNTPTTFEMYLAMVLPADRDIVTGTTEQILSAGANAEAPSTYTVEHRLLAPNGETRWVELRGRVMLDEHGAPSCVVGTAVDVTRRKAAQAALLESEETFRMYTELASDYIYEVNLDSPVLMPSMVAGSFTRTTGLTPQDVADVGGWGKVIHPDDREVVEKVIGAVINGQPQLAEYRIHSGSGEIVWLRDRIRPIIDDRTGRTVMIRGAVQDITEQKTLEAQLLRARKDESLARFAGDVAHDFNNLLMVISGAVEVVKLDPASDRVPEMLAAIEEAAERAAELTHGMLLFGRRDAGDPKLLSADSIVSGGAAVLRQGLGRRGELITDVRAPMAHVLIDPSQAQLMLLNLVVNARHAIGDGGKVELTVDTVTFEAHAARPVELVPGDYVTLAVRDDGVGVPAELQSVIFEPFFTTREDGKGSGMGLAACRGIALKAGGTITLESTEGEGATFTIYLPRQSPNADTAPAASVKVSVGGDESLLVVDDDAALRRIFAFALRDRGYEVTLADTAEQALELLETFAYDLVISDVVMPGMGGIGLAERLQVERPDLPVLLMSGNADASHAHFPFLGKPVSPDALARMVRELLDA